MYSEYSASRNGNTVIIILNNKLLYITIYISNNVYIKIIM